MDKTKLVLFSSTSILSVALIALFFQPILVSNIEYSSITGEILKKTPGDALVLGGWAHIVHKDAQGNILSEERVHNRFVDNGEDFALDQIFEDGTTTADNGQIGAICLFQGTIVVAETETAGDFDGDNTLTEANCKEDNTVTTTGSTAVIGPITFTCGGTNCANGDTIAAIAICQNDVTDNTDTIDCATEGIMFSVIDITDVTLAASETVDIDYTFDITSASE